MIVVVAIVIAMPMLILINGLLDGLELTGGAATYAPYVGFFLVLAIVIPAIAFGVNRVRGD